MAQDTPYISDEVVRNLAKLSRLEVEAKAVERLRGEMAEILAYIEHFRALDLTSVPPTLHPVVLDGNLREDVVGDALAKEDLLRNAPESNDDGVVVPRVVG